MRLRPVKSTDIDAMEQLAHRAGSGLTHLPKNRDALVACIQKSLSSFNAPTKAPKDEEYIFVLEDHEKNTIVGTSAIFAKSGIPTPFYVFRIEDIPAQSKNIPAPKEPRLLRLNPYFNGPTEVGGLYLLPESRREGLGKLLSLSRFLFIATHRHRFTSTILANMRGLIENDQSLFWNGIGRKFYDITLNEIMNLRIENKALVEELFPPYPIYVTLLPKEVQESIGQIHPNTKSALKMLMQEGFQYTNEIDPFDGGPIISAEVSKIATINNSIAAVIDGISNTQTFVETYLISNTRIDFRTCLGKINCITKERVTLPAEIADALEVKKGDQIRYTQSPSKL